MAPSFAESMILQRRTLPVYVKLRPASASAEPVHIRDVRQKENSALDK